MTARPAVKHTTGYELERAIGAAGSVLIAGVDEVGRGAWAGPVVVCAAIARAGFPEPPVGLTDSKRLTAKRRAELAAELPAWVEAYAFGSASHEEIDARGMSPYHRLSWSYLDDLPAWRHLKKHRPAIEGQLSLL
jgi:ribonuclease HII